jgi:hypothetical protein
MVDTTDSDRRLTFEVVGIIPKQLSRLADLIVRLSR